MTKTTEEALFDLRAEAAYAVARAKELDGMVVQLSDELRNAQMGERMWEQRVEYLEEQLRYYEEMQPDLATAWEVKRRMEDV